LRFVSLNRIRLQILHQQLLSIPRDTALYGVSPEDLSYRRACQTTARLRYAQMKAFFNFIIERTHTGMVNPCNDSLLSKTFRAPRMRQRVLADRSLTRSYTDAKK